MSRGVLHQGDELPGLVAQREGEPTGLLLYAARAHNPLRARVGGKPERRQQLWSRELERFFELEELAGLVAERVGGSTPLKIDLSRRARA